MAEPRIHWRNGAFQELRKLPALERHLHDLAENGADAGGEGYVAVSGQRPQRAHAAVIATSIEAQVDNAENHTLVGPVIDAMRS